MPRLLIAIPAWNEQASVREVVRRVQDNRPDATVLVVDDGSTDLTADEARSAGARVVSLPFNVGVGGAMRTAFLFAVRHGYDTVVQVDADGQHEPSELDQLIKALGSFDIVVGNRFHLNSEYLVRGPRRWAMKMLGSWLSRMSGSAISDPTSGFRAAGPRAVELFADDYPAEYLGDTVGSLSIAIKHGLSVGQVPVTMYFREHGRPSKNAIWSALYLGRAMLALIVTALKSPNRTREESI